MSEYPDSYIVELEEKKKKKNYSEDFYNELR